MKRKSVLAFLLTGVMLVSGGISVFAADANVTGGTTTGSTPTSFVVDSSVLGGDLIVSVPADLTLIYDEDTGTFINDDVIIAKGGITADKKLEVKTPGTVTYVNGEDNAITIDGVVTFGNASGDDMVTEWSATELYANVKNPVGKPISVEVDSEDLVCIGSYSTTITYNFSVVNK